MPKTSGNSEEIPRPGVIGRVVRGAAGIVLVLFTIQIASQAPAFVVAEKSRSIPGGDWWIVALACFLALPRVVNDGFARNWGRWPQVVYLGLVGLAVLWDLRANSVLWGVPLALILLALILYVLGYSGISFLVAAAAATPG